MAYPPLLAQPSPTHIANALADFAITVEAVTRVRALQFGPGWIGVASPYIAEGVMHAQRIRDDGEFLNALNREIEESPAAFGILWAELFATNFQYRELTGLEIEIGQGPLLNLPFEVEIDPFSERAVKDLDTVKGSIEKIISRLPPWLKKLLEALMEMLKLSRGVIG